MTDKSITPEMIALIPALEEWGDAEIDLEDWVAHEGSYELAIGYSRVFWPRIIEFRGYILLERYANDEAIDPWEKSCNGNKVAVEALLNHIHPIDLQSNGSAYNETQLIELGRTLKEIYQAKLAWSFPHYQFKVEFDDTPGLPAVDYQVTFWRVRGD